MTVTLELWHLAVACGILAMASVVCAFCVRKFYHTIACGVTALAAMIGSVVLFDIHLQREHEAEGPAIRQEGADDAKRGIPLCPYHHNEWKSQEWKAGWIAEKRGAK